MRDFMFLHADLIAATICQILHIEEKVIPCRADISHLFPVWLPVNPCKTGTVVKPILENAFFACLGIKKAQAACKFIFNALHDPDTTIGCPACIAEFD